MVLQSTLLTSNVAALPGDYPSRPTPIAHHRAHDVTSIEPSHAANVERIDLFTLRLITYAPRASVQRWIAEELAGLRCAPYFTPSLRAAFEALAEEYRRRVLIVDYDSLSKEELVELRTLRKRVPSGTFIALGQVREHLRAPLRVTHVLTRPLGSERLREIVDELDRQRDTAEHRQLVT